MSVTSPVVVVATRKRGSRSNRPPLTAEQSRLAASYFPFARKLAKSLKARWPNLRDEFDSAVGMALVEAAQSFDISRRVKFSTFARYRVWGAMQDVMRNAYHTVYDEATGESQHIIIGAISPYAEEYGRVLNMSPDAPIGFELSAIEEVIKMSSCLPPKHGEVIRFIYIQGLTHRQAASIMGCSLSRIDYMHREAIAMYRGSEAVRAFYAVEEASRRNRKEKHERRRLEFA